jgi:hypothetical protein
MGLARPLTASDGWPAAVLLVGLLLALLSWLGRIFGGGEARDGPPRPGVPPWGTAASPYGGGGASTMAPTTWATESAHSYML